jgi:hypothetical protein
MWNDNMMQALHRWMGPFTWGKSHPLDDGRFYDFVLVVWQEVGDLWNETEAREILVQQAKELHPEFDQEYCAQFIERYHQEASLILNFLLHTKAEGQTLHVGP